MLTAHILILFLVMFLQVKLGKYRKRNVTEAARVYTHGRLLYLYLRFTLLKDLFYFYTGRVKVMRNH